MRATSWPLRDERSLRASSSSRSPAPNAMWLTKFGRPRPVEIAGSKSPSVVVVQVPEREQLAVAGVVEEVPGPAVLEERDDVDLDELEAHRLGVEAVAGFEVPGRDGDVVERHARKSATLCRMDRRPARAARSDVVDPDPLVQFRRWYDDAVAGGVRQPDAMTLATVAEPTATPDARTVLLRGLDAARLRVLHEPRERQGARADRARRPGRARVPLARARAAGAGDRIRSAGSRPRRSDAYWESARAVTGRAPGRRRRATWSNADHARGDGSPRSKRASPATIRRCRRSGAATSWRRRAGAAGRVGTDRLHDRVRYRPGRRRRMWIRERLAP